MFIGISASGSPSLRLRVRQVRQISGSSVANRVSIAHSWFRQCAIGALSGRIGALLWTGLPPRCRHFSRVLKRLAHLAHSQERRGDSACRQITSRRLPSRIRRTVYRVLRHTPRRQLAICAHASVCLRCAARWKDFLLDVGPFLCASA